MTETLTRAERPPVADLCRQASFTLRAVDSERDDEGDGLTFDGYGAVFNRETVIDSWEGRFREVIAPGAMKKSFRELTPKLQFDHGHHPLIGSIPIGRMEAGYPREEVDPDLAPDGGAHVVARLHDNWLVQPVREALASRAIDGMSFRFSVNRETWTRPDGSKIRNDDELMAELYRSWREEVPDDELLLRTLNELRVPEIGPVVWPAYDSTSAGVRSTSLVIDLGKIRTGDPSERNKLAQAVLMADRAEEAAQPSTPSPEDGAAEHPDDLDDTQRSTSLAETEDAAEHLSESTPRIERRHVVEDLREVMRTIQETKGRYSR